MPRNRGDVSLTASASRAQRESSLRLIRSPWLPKRITAHKGGSRKNYKWIPFLENDFSAQSAKRAGEILSHAKGERLRNAGAVLRVPGEAGGFPQ